MRKTLTSILFATLLTATAPSFGENLQTADIAKVDNDYAIQGEYSGEVRIDGGAKVGAQVVALGKGAFRAVIFIGGLPGDGWVPDEKMEFDSITENGKVVFKGDHGIGTMTDGHMVIDSLDGNQLGKLKRVERKSLTLGRKPPQGAKVLFDGTSVDHWVGASGGAAEMSDGLLHQGANSKDTFQDCEMHIEFLLPFAPDARGQARGNSGLYLQGRYEVQMLDSFGLEGEQNECGGIYEIAAPKLNMCYPPLQWQTYDVEFTAAKFDDTGIKTKNARITVRHNGVTIHNNVDLTGSTRAAPLGEGPDPGFIHLQNHGNPVRYRNIWVLNK